MKNSPTVLLTGASGLLGKALARRLAPKNVVVGVSRSAHESTRAYDLADAQQVEKLFGSEKFDAVIHAAAYSDVDGCELNPQLAHECNALSTKHLASECFKNKIPLIYISTDYVFDGHKRAPYQEDDLTGPINIYGMTKLEGEYHARLAPVSVVVRTSWIFGHGKPSDFVNTILGRLQSGEEIRVLDDQEDAPTYAEDLAAVIDRILDHCLSEIGKNSEQSFTETFHVCNQGHTTRYGMALRIKEWLGRSQTPVEKMDKKFLQNRLAIRPAYAVLSTKKYENFFQVRLRSWEDSLKEYVHEWREEIAASAISAKN